MKKCKAKRKKLTTRQKPIPSGLHLKYFVLKPRGGSPYARASRKAMLAYADAIEKTNFELATELRVWARKEEEGDE